MSSISVSDVDNYGLLNIIDKTLEGDDYDEELDIYPSLETFFVDYYSAVIKDDYTAISDTVATALYGASDDSTKSTNFSSYKSLMLEALTLIREKIKNIIEAKVYYSYIYCNAYALSEKTRYVKMMTILANIVTNLAEINETVYYDENEGTNYYTPISICDGYLKIEGSTITAKNLTTSAETVLTSITADTLSNALFGYDASSLSSSTVAVMNFFKGTLSDWIYITYSFSTASEDGNITYKKGKFNKFESKYWEFLYFVDKFIAESTTSGSVDEYLKKYYYDKRVEYYRDSGMVDESSKVSITQERNLTRAVPILREKFNGKAGNFGNTTTLLSGYAQKGKTLESIKLPTSSIIISPTTFGVVVTADDWTSVFGTVNPYRLIYSSNKTNALNYYKPKVLPFSIYFRPTSDTSETSSEALSLMKTYRRDLEVKVSELTNVSETYTSQRLTKKNSYYYYLDGTKVDSALYQNIVIESSEYILKTLSEITFTYSFDSKGTGLTESSTKTYLCPGFMKIQSFSQKFVDSYLQEPNSGDFTDDELEQYSSIGDDRSFSIAKITEYNSTSDSKFISKDGSIYLKIPLTSSIVDYDGKDNKIETSLLNIPYANISEVLVEFESLKLSPGYLTSYFKINDTFKVLKSVQGIDLSNLYEISNILNKGIKNDRQINSLMTFELENLYNKKDFIEMYRNISKTMNTSFNQEYGIKLMGNVVPLNKDLSNTSYKFNISNDSIKSFTESKAYTTNYNVNFGEDVGKYINSPLNSINLSFTGGKFGAVTNKPAHKEDVNYAYSVMYNNDVGSSFANTFELSNTFDIPEFKQYFNLNKTINSSFEVESHEYENIEKVLSNMKIKGKFKISATNYISKQLFAQELGIAETIISNGNVGGHNNVDFTLLNTLTNDSYISKSNNSSDLTLLSILANNNYVSKNSNSSDFTLLSTLTNDSYISKSDGIENISVGCTFEIGDLEISN